MIGPLFEKGKIGVLREAPTNKKKTWFEVVRRENSNKTYHLEQIWRMI